MSMNKNKFYSYLGFASKSGNLVAGISKVENKIDKGYAKLVIIGEDVGNNTLEKLLRKCKAKNVNCRVFDSCENLGYKAGKAGKGIFAILDKNFADVILREIDQIQSEKEEF